MDSQVLIAVITAVPATITALAMWRQSSAKVAPPPSPPPATGHAPHSLPPSAPATPPSRQWVIFLVGAVVTVAVLLLASQLLPDDDEDGNQREDVQEQVTVDGKERFTDTGIVLAQGDVVTVTATGEVFHSVETRQKAGPNGDPGKRFASNVLQSSDHGSLIGKVGTGSPFHVGVILTFFGSGSV